MEVIIQRAEQATQGATQEATGGATRGATQEATQGATQEATREVTAAEPQPTQPSASANTLALILMEATPAVATLTEATLTVATLTEATLTVVTLTEAILMEATLTEGILMEAILMEAIAGAAWADFVQRLAPTRMAALALTLTEARARTGPRSLAMHRRAATQSPRCPTSL